MMLLLWIIRESHKLVLCAGQGKSWKMATPPISESRPARLPFTTKPIPRLRMDDPQAFELLKREEPVLLTNVSMVEPLVGKWTVDYLAEKFPPAMPFSVFTSNSQFFQYWDDQKNQAGYQFTPPTKRTEMTFRQVKTWDDRVVKLLMSMHNTSKHSRFVSLLSCPPRTYER